MRRRTSPRVESLEGRALLSGLSYSLTTNQSSYQPGQPVVMTFQETNVSNHEISVSVGPSIDGFDVSQGGNVIWRSNAGPNPMFIELKQLQPGQSLTLSATWDDVPTGGTSPVTGNVVISNQLDPQLTTTVAIGSSTSTPSANPSSPPSSPQPIGVVSDPDPLPAQPVSSPTNPSDSPAGVTVPTDPTTTGAGSLPVAVSVVTNRSTYHKGQAVKMTMTIQNDGSSAVSLPSGSASGLTLYEGSTPVWHRAQSAAKGARHDLDPGRTVKLTASWNGKAHSAGVALAAGTYTLEAVAGDAAGSTTFHVA